MIRRTLPYLMLAALASPASAVTLDIQSPSGTSAPVGSDVALEVWMTGTRDEVIAAIQFELLPATGGARFGDAFAPSAAIAPYLGTLNDVSLANDNMIALAAGVGVEGIPVGNDALLLGTFWLQTPVHPEASYVVGIDPSSIELLTPTLESLPAAAGALTITTVVPEPGTAALACMLSGLQLVRRRRCN
jgi:hypothetical protein